MAKDIWDSWHDIDDPSGRPSPQKEEAAPPQQPAGDKEKPKEKEPPEFKITGCKIIVPPDGLKKDKPFDFEGTVEPIETPINKKRVLVDAVTDYKGTKDYIARKVEVFIDEKAHTFSGTCTCLYFNNRYLSEDKNAADTKFTLYLIATAAAAEKEYTSEAVSLPMPTKQTILKKGTYDDTWTDAKNDPGTYPKSGENFIPDRKVQKLQENLIKFRLLAQGLHTGYFGEETEKAVTLLQELSKRQERKKVKDGRILYLDQRDITFAGSVDGIVDEKTENEMAVWLQNDYIKPDPEYRKGDFDEEGYQNGHGPDRKDDHFHEKYQIMDFQGLLSALGAYAGKHDGWFWEKTETAVKWFQECAEKGEFINAKNEKVVLEEKDRMKGHRPSPGVLDWVKLDYAKKIKSKGLKVPKEDYSSYIAFDATLESDRQKILSKKSKNILGAIAKQTGYQTVTITSTIRYPNQQAEAMYTNLSNKKRLSYAAPGMAVTAVYDDCINKGYDKAKTIAKMVDKINSLSLEGMRVSKHCVSVEEYNKVNIVDIAIPSSKVREFITALAKDDNIEKIYHDIRGIVSTGKIAQLAKEPCIHVEIKQ